MALALSLYEGKCQSKCGNLDFEDGNFGNWKTYTGYTESIDSMSYQSFDPCRFEITSGGYDAVTGYVVPMVAPGGTHSCRLGNSNIGAEAEKITYSLNVSDSNALFIYKYAIVLEDPGHLPEEQPQFEVKILDENGDVADQTCGYYQVSAASDIPGFQVYGDVVFKNWTTVGIDMTPYIGQNITICFISKDCSLGGHFGYAYIDAESSWMELETIACAGDDSILLSAPYGFDYLWQPGAGTGRTMSVAADQVGNIFNCTLTSVTGCQVELTVTAEIIYVVPDFSYFSCDGVWYTGETTSDPGDITLWEWNFGDGGSGYGMEPEHSYDGEGPYSVQLTATNNIGCTASVTKNVKVIHRPLAKLDPLPTCAGMPDMMDDLSEKVVPGVTSYLWDFGDGTFSSEHNPLKIYDNPGSYLVTLTVRNGPGCKDKTMAEIEIKDCEVQIPNVFTPNSDGINETFLIRNLEYCSRAELTIFNRWGYPVFRSDKYNNNWQPENISSGVYYYIFEYSPNYPSDAELEKTGFVTVFGQK